LKKVLNYMGLKAVEVKFTPLQLATLFDLVKKKRITPEQGELILRELVKEPSDPENILKKLGLLPIERSELEEAIAKAVDANQEAVKDYLKGKDEALNFLVGQVMRLTRGRADPREITKLLQNKLEKSQKE